MQFKKQWSTNNLTPDVCAKIGSARRKSFALLGVGLHGENGLSPLASYDIINTYITSTLLPGLNATVMSNKDLNKLDSFYHTLLRQVQSIPRNAAREAIYILLGDIPIQERLELQVLSLYGAITRLNKDNPLHQIAVRQLATKDKTSKSWFVYAARIGQKYGININEFLFNPMQREAWKNMTKRAVKRTTWTNLLDNARTKSTLKWIIFDEAQRVPHPIWKTCNGSPFHIKACAVRVKLMVSRYGLQAERAKYTKNESPLCPKCGIANEDVVHFLVQCTLSIQLTSKRITDLKRYMCRQERNPHIHLEQLHQHF